MYRSNALTSTSVHSRDALLRLSHSFLKRRSLRANSSSARAKVMPRRIGAQRALDSLRELLSAHERRVTQIVHRDSDASALAPRRELFYREVQARLPGRINELELSQASDGVYVLDGCCQCYHVKQWVQHLAMELFGSPRLLNRMRVLPAR